MSDACANLAAAALELESIATFVALQLWGIQIRVHIAPFESRGQKRCLAPVASVRVPLRVTACRRLFHHPSTVHHKISRMDILGQMDRDFRCKISMDRDKLHRSAV